MSDLTQHVVSFVRYDPATGEISGHGREAAAFVIARCERGEDCFPEAGHPRLHWFDRKAFAVRDKSPSTATLDGMTLRGLPVGGTLMVTSVETGEQQAHPIAAAEEPMTFSHPGHYTLLVRHPRYLDATFNLVWPAGGA